MGLPGDRHAFRRWQTEIWSAAEPNPRRRKLQNPFRRVHQVTRRTMYIALNRSAVTRAATPDEQVAAVIWRQFHDTPALRMHPRSPQCLNL
jgi:hypothetical protein